MSGSSISINALLTIPAPLLNPRNFIFDWSTLLNPFNFAIKSLRNSISGAFDSSLAKFHEFEYPVGAIIIWSPK